MLMASLAGTDGECSDSAGGSLGLPGFPWMRRVPAQRSERFI